jgi:hypothetical protein
MYHVLVSKRYKQDDFPREENLKPQNKKQNPKRTRNKKTPP